MMEQIKKYWLHVVAIIVLLLTVYTCSNNKQHELQGEYKQLKEQLSKIKTDLNAQEGYRQFLKDSFSREIKKSEEKVAKLVQNNLELKNKIVSLQSKTKAEKERLKNYTNEQIAQAINKRYNTKSTTSDNFSVVLKDSIPKKVVEELIEKDEYKDTVEIQDGIIDNMEKVVEEKDKVIGMKDVEIKEGEKTIKLSADALKVAEEMNKSAEKTIKQMKIKGTVVKILVPLAFIGGILIAK